MFGIADPFVQAPWTFWLSIQFVVHLSHYISAVWLQGCCQKSAGAFAAFTSSSKAVVSSQKTLRLVSHNFHLKIHAGCSKSPSCLSHAWTLLPAGFTPQFYHEVRLGWLVCTFLNPSCLPCKWSWYVIGIPWQGGYHFLHFTSGLGLMHEKSVKCSDMLMLGPYMNLEQLKC